MSSDNKFWGAFMQDMTQLERELLAVAPDCELTRIEAVRYLSRLLRYAIGKYIDRSAPLDQPRLSYETARIGGDNPDYRYCIADLDGRLNYRLSGNINDAYRLNIGTYAGGLGTAIGMHRTGSINIASHEAGQNGRFELILSAAEQKTAQWLPMSAETNSLIVRQVVLDPVQHRPAELEIDCLANTMPTEALPATAADIEAGMAEARKFLVGAVRQFIGWTANFMAFPNTLRPLDPELLSAAQGDPSTYYYNGYYRLQPGEVLVVEFTPPPCDYWNLQACNHWLESLDALGQPTHINHYLAKPDAAGRVRALITPETIYLANWIDTVGHRQGCLAMRWVGLPEGEFPPVLNCYVSSISQLEE